MAPIPSLKLNDGNSIPLLGFGTGTAQSKRRQEKPGFNQDLVDILEIAIKQGIRHIDGAEGYANEEEIGVAIKESGIPREELFITTKVRDIRTLPGAIDVSLEKLQLEYVDLYLIHSPYGAKELSELQTAWLAMESIQKSGKAKSIGVSNHLQPHIEAILEVATIVPAVNQIEFHPYLQRGNNLVPWLKEHGIEVTSYNGLTPLRKGLGGPLDGPLKEIAKKYGVSENAVLIQWQIHQGIVPITTSSKPERLAEYLQGVELKLEPEEVEEITRVGLTHHFRASQLTRFEPDDRS
ncbi:Aldo/keto reductase [Mollisia scopiformis]|uniref:Aldo/keto reductase n=1 Tax=Mollisia scopiformis TaxID=149040 RepID=A0A194XB99_MOLSC|nr:Aldo/keto reductase [Mollisia scopiformis]KUJ17037.1 Aldo/keto reductase [Mollisia scopiformis]